MFKQILLRKLFVYAISALISYSLFGQGSTRSILNGLVETNTKETLIGATVVAIHDPTGSQYSTLTNEKGYFTIPNVRVGGPYTIRVSYVGYNPEETKGIYTKLGQTRKLYFSLDESSTLKTVEVVASNGVFDGNRTGSESNIDNYTVNNAPTIQRELSDYVRLTPSAKVLPGNGLNGISVAGVNNRYNAIFIDGAINNDVFGLASSGTNGGQAGVSPVSIDAIEQINVNVAPYDVKYGGFSGASINAVTRSGSNSLEGSAYYLIRNHTLSGVTPTDDAEVEKTKLNPFSSQIYGGRLGGPIVKDKVFFFVNLELESQITPLPFSFDNYDGNSTQQDIDNLINYVNNTFDYNPGGYLDNSRSTDAQKFLVKFDFNLGEKHNLSFRHSLVRAKAIRQSIPSSRSLYFYNTGNDFPSTTNSSALEWNFRISNNLSNDLTLGYTAVDDNRDIIGDPFPRVEINDGGATIYLGTDAFSYTNLVDQDILTITDNFSWYKGIHSFTFGTHNEFFRIQNLFAAFSTPLYDYNSLSDFISGNNAFFLFGHELPDAGQDIRFGDEADNLGLLLLLFSLLFIYKMRFNFSLILNLLQV